MALSLRPVTAGWVGSLRPALALEGQGYGSPLYLLPALDG